MHWILHVLGIDTQQSYFYDFWSGFGTQLTVMLSGVGLYHKHNCNVPRCLRLGRNTVDGIHFCNKHLPPSHVLKRIR